jgi:hypothetical protein
MKWFLIWVFIKRSINRRGKVFKWISQHRTYTLIIVLVIAWFGYRGYVNVWEPAAIAAEAKAHAGESVAFGKEIVKFVAQRDILDMLKTLLPILIPIYLFNKKRKMDAQVRQKTNYVVREKIGIGDRRKCETPEQAKALAQQHNRRTDVKKKK